MPMQSSRNAKNGSPSWLIFFHCHQSRRATFYTTAPTVAGCCWSTCQHVESANKIDPHISPMVGGGSRFSLLHVADAHGRVPPGQALGGVPARSDQAHASFVFLEEKAVVSERFTMSPRYICTKKKSYVRRHSAHVL